MQSRFCICGFKVLVRYFSNGWNPMFLSKQEIKKAHKICIETCPKCGTQLNINALN